MKITPYKEKKISEINEKDSRIKIIGTVLDVDENKITVDDGSGNIDILLGEYSKIDSRFIKIGDLIKIFGRVYSKDSIKVFGDVAQVINGLDIKKYLEIKSKMKKLRGEMEDV